MRRLLMMAAVPLLRRLAPVVLRRIRARRQSPGVQRTSGRRR